MGSGALTLASLTSTLAFLARGCLASVSAFRLDAPPLLDMGTRMKKKSTSY